MCTLHLLIFSCVIKDTSSMKKLRNVMVPPPHASVFSDASSPAIPTNAQQAAALHGRLCSQKRPQHNRRHTSAACDLCHFGIPIFTNINGGSICDNIFFPGSDHDQMIFVCILPHRLCVQVFIAGIHTCHRTAMLHQCPDFRIISTDTGWMDVFDQCLALFSPITRTGYPDRINDNGMS